MTRVANFRARRARRSTPNPDGSMSLMEHLRELRSRLFKSVAAVAVAAVGVFLFYDPLYDFLTEPYCRAIEGTQQPNCTLVFLDLTSPFATQLRISAWVGVLVATPVLFFQLWRFIAPGLYRNERRYALAFVGSSVTFFMLGAALAYYSLPKIFNWMINQAGDAVIQNKADDYFRLLALMVGAFGLSFEFPLVLFALQVMGVVTPEKLASLWRHAVVGIVAVVAIITPGGDPISLAVLSVPLVIFYAASIALAKVVLRRRAQRTSR